MQDLMSLIHQAGFTGNAANIMYGIVMAESGGNAQSLNNNPGTGDLSYGLAQINMIGAMGPERLRQYGLSSNEDLFNPLTNLKVAYALSGGGRDFSPWSTYKSGAYQQYVGQSGAKVTSTPGGSAGANQTNAGPTADDFKSALGPLAGLLQGVPELRQLLGQAVSGGWSTTKFQQAVQASDWYRTHNAAAREWIALKYSDPAEYKARGQAAMNQVSNIASSMGVRLSHSQLGTLGAQFIINGWDQQTLQRQVGKFYDMSGSAAPQGQGAQYFNDLKQLYSDYGVPISDTSIQHRVRQLLMGNTSIDAYKTSVIDAAKSMYPSLAAQLDGGLTVRDIADPYRQTMAQTLEIDPNSINVSDPLIKRALQGSVINTNGKTTATSTPIWQFEQQLRNDPRWAQTNNARDTISSALLQVGHDFGFGPTG